MANNLQRLRERAGLTPGQLAEKVGVSPLEIRRIESGEHPAEIGLAKALCTALNQPIDAVFPGSSKAIASYQKELQGPTNVSRETYELLRKVGLEGDTRRHTLKVLLRGHESPMFFPLEPHEVNRMFRAVQHEDPEDEGISFIVFDTDDLRVAINLKAAMFLHFLWDPGMLTVLRSDEDDGEESRTQAVHIFFNEDTNPTIIGAESEDGDDIENEQNYINNVFLDLDTGGIKPNVRLHIVDEDGESAFLRAGDISLLTAPLWVLDRNLLPDPDDED